MLESNGVIESRANGAFVVAGPAKPFDQSLDLLLTTEQADYAELFEVRRIVEAEAAALAAERATKAQLARMRAAIDAMAEGLASEDRFIDADLRFHLTIAEATKNRILVHLMHAVRALLLRSLSSSFNIPGSPESAIDAHRRILAAIESGKPEQARRRMLEHVSRVERDIKREGERRT